MNNPYLKQYQTENLRRAQLKMLDILIAVDDICRRHDIPYWLDAGTLLGAVRHGGFIPWDDDIDIAMTTADLKRFLEVAPSELPPHLFMQMPGNEPTKEPLPKIRDLKSFFVEPGDDFSAPYEKGLYVDIFPYVTYPNVSAAFIRRVTKNIARSRSILSKPHHYSLHSTAEFFWFGSKLIFNKVLWSLAHVFCPTSRSQRTGYDAILNGCGNSHLKSTVWPLSTVEFEGRTFSAPGNIDVYLSDLFGNYMQVPPSEKRQIHSVFIMPEL